MHVPEPPSLDPAREADIDHLMAENERLRSLVGPSEKSYELLKADARLARDIARRAEFEAGRSRAEILRLENEVRRWRRDFVWFRNHVIRRIPALARVFNRGRQP